jgi:hypothetical protein
VTKKTLTPSEFIATAAAIASTVQCSMMVSAGRMVITMVPESPTEPAIELTTQLGSDGNATHLYVMDTAPRQNRNYFPSLNEALASEGLVDWWPLGKSLAHGETYSFTFEDGSPHGHFVSIYRDEQGRYERPVHYRR